MLDFEAIDAKIGRARKELRSLKADIQGFCQERARLIVPEDRGETARWVYRGDTPKPPIDWSIRVGEFIYNLRSSLDHLVWELVEANGNTPDERNTAFPLGAGFNKSLGGISTGAKEYIQSIQPNQDDALGVGHRLFNLNAIGNIDKHRRIIDTHVRWTGIEPRIINRLSWGDQTGTGGYTSPIIVSRQPGPTNLEHGICLFSTDWKPQGAEYLQIPVEAAFAEANMHSEPWGDGLSVPETLDECIVGVEVVVAHFKFPFGENLLNDSTRDPNP